MKSKINITKSIILGLLINICAGLQILPEPPRLQFPGISSKRPLSVAAKQISPDLFSCNSTNTVKKTFCTLALEKINAELVAAGIAIDNNGALFSYEKGTDVPISTGHSCSVTAKLTHQRASARFLRTTSLNLTATSLSHPIAIRLRLPVSLYVRLDVLQRFGFKFFGKCRNYASDSYYISASLTTESDTIIGLSLNPSLRRVSETHYAFVIKPIAVLMFALENTALSFSAKNVNRLTPLLNFIKGFGSTVLKSIAALFDGKSVKHIWEEIVQKGLPWDFGATLALGVGNLPSDIEDFILGHILDFAEEKLEKKAAGYGPDIQDKLNEEISKAFNLDANGERAILISAAYAQTLLGK